MIIAEKEISNIEIRLWERHNLKKTELICFSIRLVESLREAKSVIKLLSKELYENKKKS